MNAETYRSFAAIKVELASQCMHLFLIFAALPRQIELQVRRTYTQAAYLSGRLSRKLTQLLNQHTTTTTTSSPRDPSKPAKKSIYLSPPCIIKPSASNKQTGKIER